MECKNIWKVEWKRVNIACIHQAQMHSPCMKDQHRKAISTYCHKRHLLGQFFIQYWPLLVPMGSKDYRNPALIIFRATLTRSLELKEQHCSARKELTKVTLAKIQLLLDYSNQFLSYWFGPLYKLWGAAMRLFIGFDQNICM